MSSFASTVDLSPRPSLKVFRGLFFLHVGLLLLLGFGLEPGAPLFAGLTLLTLSWVWLRRHPVFGFGPRAITRLIWHEDGQWILTRGNGESSEAELLPYGIVHPRVLVLNFRFKSGVCGTRILLGDELPDKALRRLRARLLAARSEKSI